ncbi:glycosyl transferase [Mycolicibacterium rhodesiae NBB3]|uniref:Glycosyl transferase n=1 Tax=Mycolicibacterium rhodesiae (strain NBB3) TaxID=710685 RepID=G8RX45_MYCRN|nr:glycosyltransferase family 2 protein [Mycolicibacterium rhodesiae]AEV71902.1 glycosyl transferase [Mycolicibacterium rhodesiae NBB3]
MTLLIVTPMHDEADNVSGIVATLRAQRFQDFDWVAVDDGSTDGTAELLAEVDPEDLVMVVSKTNDGGLIGGSAFSAWRFGVAKALPRRPYSHVMKLDADVRLAPDYLERVTELARGGVGIAGGLSVSEGMKEQKFHVMGAVKMYTLEAYRAIESMPTAIGFDILDEVAARLVGLETRVDTGAHFELARYTGASEGLSHGRYRNGRGCRWTGYWFPYFLVHCGRYLVRRPYVTGSLAMLWGYLRAGRGPYGEDLKKAHAQMQRAKLARAVRNPVKFWREAYKI